MVRVDNRLIHGQILEAWVPHIQAKCIIIADDNVAGDFFYETAMRIAVPSEIELIVITVAEFVKHYDMAKKGGKKTIVLFSTVTDAIKAYNLGFQFDELNIGNIHNDEYKICCAPFVFLSDNDIENIHQLLEEKKVRVRIKSLPRDRDVNFVDAISEYCGKSHKAGI